MAGLRDFAMVRVVFTEHLRRHVELPDVEVSGDTVAEVLQNVFASHPQARGYVLDDQGSLRQHVAVFVDGRTITDRRRLSDSVAGAREVYVLQALSGG